MTCAPIDLTHPPIPLANWPAPAHPWRLPVPRACRSFRSGEWHIEHCHLPESVALDPSGCRLLFCEPAGPYLVACVQRVGFRPLLLDRRTGRVLREVKITEPWGENFEDPHEGLVQRRARAIESATLAVLTLHEQYVGGRSCADGESWLRQQLSTLREGA